MEISAVPSVDIPTRRRWRQSLFVVALHLGFEFADRPSTVIEIETIDSSDWGKKTTFEKKGRRFLRFDGGAKYEPVDFWDS